MPNGGLPFSPLLPVHAGRYLIARKLVAHALSANQAGIVFNGAIASPRLHHRKQRRREILRRARYSPAIPLRNRWLFDQQLGVLYCSQRESDREQVEFDGHLLIRTFCGKP
jgi:hypothetical protein